MERYKKQIIIGSAVLAVLIVVGAGLIVRQRRHSTTATFTPATTRNVTKAELAKGDGKEGRDCLVAVDAVVYKIAGFALWQNGEHIPSEGQAYCGADLTEAISKSPHGRSKLGQLEKIGPLLN